MQCGCITSTSVTCSTVYPVLSPCACDDPAPIRIEGTDGNDGDKGATPKFTIGTVGAGEASVTVVVTDEFNRVINWVLPAVPEGEAYAWTAVNTFEQPSVFELGLQTTGGTSTFGGLGLTVTPDATFSANVDIGGDVEIAGDANVTTNLNEDGQLTVQGASIFEDLEFFSQTNISQWELSLPDISEFGNGVMVVGSCLNAQKQPNIGRGLFTKAEGANLVAISPVDNGPICDPIVINVPVSTCPQAAPIVDFRVRVGYRFLSAGGFGLGNNFNAEIEQVSGSVQIDFYTQGDGVWNATGGFIELRGQAQLAAGNNNFNVNVTNSDASETWTPTSLTYWVTG